MDIWMIWVMDAADNDYVWLAAARDENLVENQNDEWESLLSSFEQEYGARYVRVTKGKVDLAKVFTAFEPVDVSV